MNVKVVLILANGFMGWVCAGVSIYALYRVFGWMPVVFFPGALAVLAWFSSYYDEKEHASRVRSIR